MFSRKKDSETDRKTQEVQNTAEAQDSAAQEKKSKDARMTNLVVILTAVILAAVSAVILFVPGLNIQPISFIYVIGAIFVIVGIIFIVRYFLTDAYKNINEYGFSTGTLIVIIGICILLRADALVQVFDLMLGISVLLMGVLMLQHSLDLKRMLDMIWALVLVFSIIVMLCGVFMILKLAPEKIDYPTYNWWLVLISSGLGLITNIYTLIRVAIFNKKEKKKAEQPAEKPADKTEEMPVPADSSQLTSSATAEPETLENTVTDSITLIENAPAEAAEVLEDAVNVSVDSNIVDSNESDN